MDLGAILKWRWLNCCDFGPPPPYQYQIATSLPFMGIWPTPPHFWHHLWMAPSRTCWSSTWPRRPRQPPAKCRAAGLSRLITVHTQPRMDMSKISSATNNKLHGAIDAICESVAFALSVEIMAYLSICSRDLSWLVSPKNWSYLQDIDDWTYHSTCCQMIRDRLPLSFPPYFNTTHLNDKYETRRPRPLGLQWLGVINMHTCIMLF